MSKIGIYSGIVFTLIIFLLLPKPSYAAVCGDPSLGITYDPESFTVGSGDLTLNFHLTNPNTLSAVKYARLRFGNSGLGAFGDTYIPNPRDAATANGIAVNSTNFSITISNENSSLKQIGNHPGELQWTQTAGGSFEHNSCPISYQIESAPAICQLDTNLLDQYQPNTPVTIQFGGSPNTRYYLFLLVRQGLGYRSDTRQPVDNIITNNRGQGVFNGVVLRGSQSEQLQILITRQQDPDKASGDSCGKPIQLTIAAAPPKPKCFAESPQSPTDNYKVIARFLSPNTSYYASLNGDNAAPQSTASSGNNATELTFDLGTNNPSVGDHHITVNRADNLEEQCFDDFTKNPDGTETHSGPEPPTGPLAVTPGGTSARKCTPADVKAGKCTSGGGIPCGVNGDGVATAIGCIHTQPAALVKDILRFMIAISGGIALLLMALGAFGMITSAGNPDNLKAGQDRFTNALIGLFFVIFSILILQLIGFDILGIEGFGR